jgi:hypothetical protein
MGSLGSFLAIEQQAMALEMGKLLVFFSKFSLSSEIEQMTPRQLLTNEALELKPKDIPRYSFSDIFPPFNFEINEMLL